MRRSVSFAFAAACVGIATSAAAEPQTEEESPWSRPVVSATAGGEGFITSELRDRVSFGAAWTTRLSMGSRKGVRIELAYSGSLQPVAATEGSTLLGTGLVGTVRVNVAPWASDLLEPFVYLGAGWSRFRVRERESTATLVASDDVLQMPFGAGLAARFGRAIVDIRGGVIIASAADLLPTPRKPDESRDSAIMHRLGVSAGVGFEL
jgi:hypothetical protein